MTEPKKRRS